jgi:hypothetical protein
MSGLTPNAGKANVYFSIGDTTVTRGYDASWMFQWTSAEDHEITWHEDVEILGQTDLISEPAGWKYKLLEHPVHGTVVDVCNPKMDLQTLDDINSKFYKWEIYAAYEDLLARLVTLWTKHNVIISDAHSDNLCPCIVNGRLRYYILDGKLAGPLRCLGSSLNRLRCKQRCEQNIFHQWLLAEYIKALDV